MSWRRAPPGTANVVQLQRLTETRGGDQPAFGWVPGNEPGPAELSVGRDRVGERHGIGGTPSAVTFGGTGRVRSCAAAGTVAIGEGTSK